MVARPMTVDAEAGVQPRALTLAQTGPLTGAGLTVRDEPPYLQFRHRVDQAIVRDLIVEGLLAGVGAVVLTASKHTDNPPFGISDSADAVFETPEGLFEALRDAAQPRPATSATPSSAA